MSPACKRSLVVRFALLLTTLAPLAHADNVVGAWSPPAPWPLIAIHALTSSLSAWDRCSMSRDRGAQPTHLPVLHAVCDRFESGALHCQDRSHQPATLSIREKQTLMSAMGRKQKSAIGQERNPGDGSHGFVRRKSKIGDERWEFSLAQ